MITAANTSLAQSVPSYEENERRRVLDGARKAYKGQFSKPLKVRPTDVDDNALDNRCAPIVDKGVSFLFGDVVGIEATTETAKPDTRVQDFIDGVWGDDDDRMSLLSDAAINGGIYGHVFLKLIPAKGTMKYPRIVALDPQIVRVVTSPDDCELALAYIIEYPIGADMRRRQVIARIDPDGNAAIYDVDDTWTITNYTRKGDLGDWMQVGEQEDWPYPFAPIFECKNLPNPNEHYGTPDLTEDLIQLNNILNFVQSNTSRIIKFYAHPKMFATGVGANDPLDTDPNTILVFPESDSKLQSLEMRSDLSSSLNFAAILRSDMDEQSRVPSVALGRLAELPKGNISGVALQLLFQPLTEKTTQKRRLYGRLIREITRAALVLGDVISIDDYEDYAIDLHWSNLLPIDDLAAAQAAQALLSIGVSQSTVLSELGYDFDEEAEKIAKETETNKKVKPAAPTMIIDPNAMQNQQQGSASGNAAPPPDGDPALETVGSW